MAYEEMIKVQGARPMNGGDSSNSYAQNSTYQKGAIDAAKEVISEGIKDKLDFKNHRFDNSFTFTIADFGCSTGPNTFFTVQNIIEAIDLKYHTQVQNPSPLQYQVFFNDFTDNDFNTLFKTLPLNTKYFAAGVPGSFYKRVFPKSTINFAHSSFAVQWLSKVPEEIVDSESPAWNKGSIHCTGFSKEVATAYLNQFKRDMNSFLNARAEEIVGEGLMAIVITGRPDGVLASQTNLGLSYDLLGSSLADMAAMGLISQEKVDSFNLPLYFSTPKEMEEIIEKNGHFSIEKFEILSNRWMNEASNLSADALVSGLRAVFDGIVKQHFGNDDIADQIFDHHTEKLAHSLSNIDKASYQIILDMFFLLKRKIY